MTTPYRPSSGAEGEWFIGQWCARCGRDKCQNGSKAMADCSQDDFCQIIGNTMFMDVDDPGYPKEWVTDDDGPRCGDNRYTTHKHSISLLSVLWGAIITMLLIGLIAAHT